MIEGPCSSAPIQDITQYGSTAYIGIAMGGPAIGFAPEKYNEPQLFRFTS